MNNGKSSVENEEQTKVTIREKHNKRNKQMEDTSTVSNENSSSRNSTLSQRLSTFHDSYFTTKTFKPSGKFVECSVVIINGEKRTFEIDEASFGHHLFDIVIENLNIKEPEYFGLRFDDRKRKIWFWLNLERKISDQLKKNVWLFDFQVKFYTPDVNSLKDTLTRSYFYLQIRENIIQGIITVSFNVMALLGAYTVQSEFGDYGKLLPKDIDYIKEMKFVPKTQQTDELLIFISELHKHLSHQSKDKAIISFLWNATKLAMYGVDMHLVQNSENDSVKVGVFHSGILLYKDNVRALKFSWPQILRLTFLNKSFFVVLRASVIHNKERHLEFKCANSSVARRLWRACIEHHAFFRLFDVENPRKAIIFPGFRNRKYQLGSNSNNSFKSYSVVSSPVTMTVRSNILTRSITERNQKTDSITSSPIIIAKRPQYKLSRSNTERKQKSASMSSNTCAPVFIDDELFAIEDNVPRPALPSLYWRMSHTDSTSALTMDSSGLDLTVAKGSGWQGSRANYGVKGPGRYYFEGKVLEDGLVRLGWSTNDASLDLGSDDYGYGYGNDQVGLKKNKGFKRNAKIEECYGEPVHCDDVIGCLIDLGSGNIQFSKNGSLFEIAFMISNELKKEVFYPITSIMDARIIFNFGDMPLQFTPKDNCKSLSEAPENNIIPNKYTEWKMNPFDSTKGTKVSKNGCFVQSKHNDEWHGSRANKGLFDTGKYYYEVIALEDGLAKVGWATDDADLNLGSDTKGFGYGADDNGSGIFNDGENQSYGDIFGKNDVIGCFLDLDNHKIKWSKNDQVFKEAFTIADDLVELRAFYPSACILNNTLLFNFGYKSFQFPPGIEWKPVCDSAKKNTQNSKKQNPLLPNVCSTDDVLELRRLSKNKDINAMENEKKIKELEEEKKQKMIQELERIEIQEREKRLILQRQREEKEREEEYALRRKYRETYDGNESQKIIKKENCSMARESTQIEEQSETIIKLTPEVTTEKFVDENGCPATRIIKRTKIIKRISVNVNVVEGIHDETWRESVP